MIRLFVPFQKPQQCCITSSSAPRSPCGIANPHSHEQSVRAEFGLEIGCRFGSAPARMTSAEQGLTGRPRDVDSANDGRSFATEREMGPRGSAQEANNYPCWLGLGQAAFATHDRTGIA